MINHDANTDYLPVYHTTAQAHGRAYGGAAAEPDPDWVGFGRAVLAAHQPDISDGEECAGCGGPWACCPVTVAARQHGLRSELQPELRAHEFFSHPAPRWATG
ncbi:MAG: hypothetical protein GEU94_10550 [Micromonosporaceae bacterium]|nr:hypothetical protein [Micromonosporaceae bacterium]